MNFKANKPPFLKVVNQVVKIDQEVVNKIKEENKLKNEMKEKSEMVNKDYLCRINEEENNDDLLPCLVDDNGNCERCGK